MLIIQTYIITRTQKTTAEAFLDLEQASKSMGLNINQSKAKNKAHMANFVWQQGKYKEVVYGSIR